MIGGRNRGGCVGRKYGKPIGSYLAGLKNIFRNSGTTILRYALVVKGEFFRVTWKNTSRLVLLPIKLRRPFIK